MVQLVANPIDKMIGKRIQIKRREQNYSADKLSELVGISQQQLSRYERGTNKINVAHLVNIANYLKTPISWFFIDCASEKESNEINEYDQYWNNLSDEQKQSIVTFIKNITK
ncbi:transcriptional regulator [Pasteurellaceae bacterium 15-036681]|nr:transcriptional regulator [Pasteurellaceae bacterium 15-036681]